MATPKTHYCKHVGPEGQCQQHNLHCQWPACAVPKEATTPMPDVTQRDREAAAWVADQAGWHVPVTLIRNGHRDSEPMVQAFANHRSADAARIAELEEALERVARIILSIDKGELRIGDGLNQTAVIITAALGGHKETP